MSVASRPAGTPSAIARNGARGRRGPGDRAPALALAAGALAVAVLAALVGMRVTGYALDESLFKASALHYTQDLPSSLFHDLTARATSRLYALTLAPLYALFDGDTALRLAKAWNAVLFASAAAPAYLLARFVVASRARAVAAALLCVALPWLTLTTGLYTEALAYPAALWTAWAVARAVRAPSWRRDLVVLLCAAVAIAARVQLVSLLGGYVALVAILAALEAPAGAELRDRGRAAARYVRRFPFAVALSAIGALVVLVLASRHTLGSEIDKLVGSYGEFQHRTTVPTDVPLGALVELISLALGVGLVPAIIALAWYPAAFRDRADPAARALAGTAIVLSAAVWAFALAAQGGFIGAITEERYFIYVVPFAWFAAFAALERPRVSAAAIGWSGAVLAVLLGAVALPYAFQPELFLAPAGKVAVRFTDVALPHVRDALGKGGLSGRDLLFAIAALVALALTFSWRRAPWLRRWLVAGAALAQVAITTYAFLAIDGRVADGAVARTGPPSLEARAWIDNLPGDGGDVTIVRNAVWADFPLVINTLRDDEFYNNAIRWRAGIGATGLPFEQTPVDALPLFDNTVRPSDGRLEPGVPTRRALVWPGSPIFQLHGRRIADDPYGRPFELDELDQPARASWLALGLRGDGAVLDGPPVKITAWPKGGAIVTVNVAPPPGGGGVVRFRFGGRAGNVGLGKDSAEIPVRLKACGRTSGTISALKSTRQQDGSRVGAVLRSVSIEPAGNACPR